MIKLDPTTRTITGPSGTQRLSRTEMGITTAIMRARGEAVSMADMMPAKWGADDRHKRMLVFRVTVCRLRERLQAAGAPTWAIETVRGVGLRWTQ
jgi:DNA-binding response OmpR family regulator